MNIDALEAITEYPTEDIFIHLSRNSTKHVYLETDSEKVLLDLRKVQQGLRSDDERWKSAMVKRCAHETAEAFDLAEEYRDFPLRLAEHLENTKAMYNSTQNGFLASSYAVRMMCRFVEFGDYFFNGKYASIKAFRNLMDNHCGAVSRQYQMSL